MEGTNGYEVYEGKNVFVKLKDNRKYSGKVKSVSKGIISLMDKFGFHVSFSESEIAFIEEQGVKAR